MRVREVDLAAECGKLLGFLREHLPAHAGSEYFEWLYRRNPHGTARAWVAEDDPAAAVVGAAAAFPRRMRVRGHSVVAWNLGDFAIAKDHRSLGPALRLQRACLAQVLEGREPFAYDHPSCSMMAIYKRMGITSEGRVVRFAKPLRVDDKVGRVVRSRVVARGVSSLGNVILGLGDALRKTPYRVRLTSDRFDDRVAALEREASPSYAVMGVRTPDYLNWRYLDHPLRKFEVMTVEDGDRLLGYAIYRVEDNLAVLSDLLTAPVDGVAETLLAAVAVAARQAGAQTLSAPVLEDSPLVSVLTGCGFRPRESAPFVVSTRAGGTWDGVVNEMSNWFHTDGDRDG